MDVQTLDQFRDTRTFGRPCDIPTLADYGFEPSELGFLYAFADHKPNTYILDRGPHANTSLRYDAGECVGAFTTLAAAESALFDFLMGEVFGVFDE